MFRKVAIVPKLDAGDSDKAVASTIDVIKEACNEAYWGPEVVTTKNIDEETLVIAVGGDGTMLEAMRLAYANHAYAIGINLGNVGFLSDMNLHSSLKTDLIDLLHSEFIFGVDNTNGYSVEDRMVLQEHHEGANAFNEFVISNLYSDQVLKYHLRIGSVSAGIHRANGLIISTPTGSTAYSLSVGGGLMLPSMEAMQIIPIAPIGLTSRPIIVPGHMPVEIRIESKTNWLLKADGAIVETLGNTVTVNKAHEKVKMVHTRDWSFFEMLTKKLGWKTHG